MSQVGNTNGRNTVKPAGAGLQKKIIGAAVVVVILVGGFFGYKQFIQVPNEEKATEALFKAEQWFEVDSLNYVLEGDGQYTGVLHVINKYGSTKAGNLARYYAGLSYLKLGDFPNAIKNLEAFNGAQTPFEALAFGALGDAYMESGDNEKGISFYKKASANTKDEFIAPLYLYRAARACAFAEKNEEAITLFQQLKKDFPFSAQAREVDKQLGLLGVAE